MAKDFKFTLCSECSQCPEVLIHGDEIHITDDYGGHVLLTQSQLDDLINRIK